jgi:hypothetical protein
VTAVVVISVVAALASTTVFAASVWLAIKGHRGRVKERRDMCLRYVGYFDAEADRWRH